MHQTGFAANAGLVQAEIYKLLNDPRSKYFVLHFAKLMDGSLLDSACMAKYLGFAEPLSKKIGELMSFTEGQRDLGITNLSRVTIQSEGKYAIKNMRFVPPVVPYCKRTIGIVTFENVMSVTMNTIAGDKDAEQKLFDNAVSCICGL